MTDTALTLRQVRALAKRAHAEQTDKIGVPYVHHLSMVAEAVAPFGEHLDMAGWLHDIIEDTDWTGRLLRDAGVPDGVVDIVEIVTSVPNQPYLDRIETIAQSPTAALLKVADNAHNSQPERLAQIADEKTRRRLGEKYRRAREILRPVVNHDALEEIYSFVNPALLAELNA